METLLYHLLSYYEKNGFKLDEEATESFERLNQATVSIPVLALSNFSLPFTIKTDASGVGLGAVLSQNARPTTYFSYKLLLSSTSQVHIQKRVDGYCNDNAKMGELSVIPRSYRLYFFLLSQVNYANITFWRN